MVVTAGNRVDHQVNFNLPLGPDVPCDILPSIVIGALHLVGGNDVGVVVADDYGSGAGAILVKSQLPTKHLGGAEALLVPLIGKAIGWQREALYQLHIGG